MLAERQTGGRGRQGRTWVSPPGNLYLSASLPLEPRERAGLLSLACGVAVRDAVAAFGAAPQLKWPNDLVLSERKLAGILLEAQSSGAALEALIVGIGLNLEVAPALSEPGPLAPTCLREELGEAPGLADVAAAVCRQLALWYDALRRGPERVLAAWRERSLPWWGQLVDVQGPEQAWRGRALGLDAEGGLELELENGRRLVVLSGEVSRVRLAAR